MPDAPLSSRGGKKVASGWQPETVTSLSASSDFARVLGSGRRRRAGGVVVARMPGPDGQIRVGYVAGKRVGKAVVRNRAKRRLREAVRRIALEPGYDYVLIADASVATAAFATLVSWVDEGVGGG